MGKSCKGALVVYGRSGCWGKSYWESFVRVRVSLCVKESGVWFGFACLCAVFPLFLSGRCGVALLLRPSFVCAAWGLLCSLLSLLLCLLLVLCLLLFVLRWRLRFLVGRCLLLCLLCGLLGLARTLCLLVARTVVFVCAVFRTLFVLSVVLSRWTLCLLACRVVSAALFALLLPLGTLRTRGLWLVRLLKGFPGWLPFGVFQERLCSVLKGVLCCSLLLLLFLIGAVKW